MGATGDTSPRTDFPDGVGDAHVGPRSALHRHASPLSVLLLGGLLLLALGGVLGGGRPAPAEASGEAADLSVDTPRTLRNGEFFEMRIAVAAKRDIARLVLSVPTSLWRDQTQNTMVPAASEESFEDGAFRFDYGSLAAGERLEVKVDLQINPASLGGTSGTVAVLDDGTELASVPIEVKILP